MIIKFECNNPDCDNGIDKFFKSATDIPPFLELNTLLPVAAKAQVEQTIND